jgi:hypothetical protein
MERKRKIETEGVRKRSRQKEKNGEEDKFREN